MREIDRLKSLNMYNDYEIANQGDKVFITYFRASFVIPSSWGVHKVNHNLGDDWYDYGAKTFVAGKKGDKNALLNAIRYASSLTGEKTWVMTPFGGYVSEYTAKKVGIKYRNKEVI